MLNLAINIDDVFILIELLYPGILLLCLHIFLFLIDPAVTSAIISITFGVYWFLHSWALVNAVRCCIHGAFLLPFVHEIGLVRNCTLVRLRSVVQDGIGYVL